jgi:hypothetical protein
LELIATCGSGVSIPARPVAYGSAADVNPLREK